MGRPFAFAVIAWLAALPGLAQPAAPLKDKEAETFKEVERGFFCGFGAGPAILLNAPAGPGVRGPLSPGQVAEVQIGFDLGPFVTISAFAWGSSQKAGSDYVGQSNGVASGDFATLVPGASIRLNLFGLTDSQGERRTWFYVRGGAGYVWFSPSQLLPNPDVTAFAGPGIEYFTRLRHFAIGLELRGSYMVRSGSLGGAVLPNLRYAF